MSGPKVAKLRWLACRAVSPALMGLGNCGGFWLRDVMRSPMARLDVVPRIGQSRPHGVVSGVSLVSRKWKAQL